MGRMRGIHDINTHSTLAREGRLVSVAKDLHRINRKGGSPEDGSWNRDVRHMIFKKDARTRRPPRDLLQDLALERAIRTAEVALVQESITEMGLFASEEVPGALAELYRLKAKLARLESI